MLKKPVNQHLLVIIGFLKQAFFHQISGGPSTKKYSIKMLQSRDIYLYLFENEFLPVFTTFVVAECPPLRAYVNDPVPDHQSTLGADHIARAVILDQRSVRMGRTVHLAAGAHRVF